MIQPTLKQLTERIQFLSDEYGTEFHICGKGDGTIKLVCEERAYTIINNMGGYQNGNTK